MSQEYGNLFLPRIALPPFLYYLYRKFKILSSQNAYYGQIKNRALLGFTFYMLSLALAAVLPLGFRTIPSGNRSRGKES
jgi:hypothetical protein